MYLYDLGLAKLTFIIMAILLVIIPVVALLWAFQKPRDQSTEIKESNVN